MVPARLIVEISLEPAMKAVYKVEAFIRNKDNNSTATAKAVRAGLNQDIQRAARRLRDTERLLFRVPDLPQRPKCQFLGAAAMATAAYAVYDVHQLLSLIHISEPTRLLSISYAVFCLSL